MWTFKLQTKCRVGVALLRSSLLGVLQMGLWGQPLLVFQGSLPPLRGCRGAWGLQGVGQWQQGAGVYKVSGSRQSVTWVERHYPCPGRISWLGQRWREVDGFRYQVDGFLSGLATDL